MIELDTRRLLCPMPVIKTQNLIATLQAGDVVRVRASDPGALHDIPAWCKVHGHEVLTVEQTPDECVVTVRVMHAR